MRQPRTLSERLELLNRLNRRQLEVAGAEEEDESEDEVALGAEEDDSGSELDDNLDDSDDNGSVSGSDSEGDFSGEEEEDSEDEEEGEEEEEGAVLPTGPPAAGTAAPGVGQPVASESPDSPEASAAPRISGNPAASGAPQASADPELSATPEASGEPDAPAASMSIINPAPTGVANNPIVPSSSAAADAELSTTAEVVSQITSAAEEPTPTPSNSLAQAENESTETASGAEASATSEEANDTGEASAQVGRGQEAGIVFGAIAGLGLMMSVGFVLFKWHKRRKASVYDRPPPPGIYREEEKRDAEVAVTQVPGEQPAGQARGGMFQMVNSWIQGMPNRYSRGAEVTPPQPAFLAGNRETMNSGTTGSDRKWG